MIQFKHLYDSAPTFYVGFKFFLNILILSSHKLKEKMLFVQFF